MSGKEFGLSNDAKTFAVGALGNNANGVDLGQVRVYQMDDSE
jgi:hypothetical protein